MATEAAGNRIQLEIVTPKGRALDIVVDEVTSPSVNGEFGLLPGHLPLLAALRAGIVSYRVGGATERVAVGQGFAEAGPHKLLILTDQFAERAEIDPVVVRKEFAEVQSRILEALAKQTDAAAGGGSKPGAELGVGLGTEVALPAEVRTLIAEENWLAVKLELYGDPPPPTMRPFEHWNRAAEASAIPSAESEESE